MLNLEKMKIGLYNKFINEKSVISIEHTNFMIELSIVREIQVECE